ARTARMNPTMVSKVMSDLVAGTRVGDGERHQREGQEDEDGIPHDQNVATAPATTRDVERSRRPSNLKIQFGLGRTSYVSVASPSVGSALTRLPGSRKCSARKAMAWRSSMAYRPQTPIPCQFVCC